MKERVKDRVIEGWKDNILKVYGLANEAAAGGGRGNVPYHKTPTLRDEMFEMRRLMKGLR